MSTFVGFGIKYFLIFLLFPLSNTFSLQFLKWDLISSTLNVLLHNGHFFLPIFAFVFSAWVFDVLLPFTFCPDKRFLFITILLELLSLGISVKLKISIF